MSVEKINELTEKRDSNPDPNQSPITMGMFATTKRWWHTIGGMDAELSTWGGENIEISLRTWLCGGEIRVARGSRIDHIYRSAFPYVVDTKLYHRNLARIVHAWMDTDDADRFYNKSHISRAIELGSFEEQAGVKRRLKCRPFAWYKNKFFNRAPLVSAPPGYDD
jgi:polypeptide N-acetylgalactosaminyltransferase